MRLTEIADVVDCKVLREGGFSTLGFLSDPQPGMLIFLESPRFAALASRTPGVSCIVTTAELAEQVRSDVGLAVSEMPRWTFHQLQSALAQSGFYGEDFATEVDATARVHPAAYVSERNVRIGRGVQIGPRAVVLERCMIREGAVIHAGAVLGDAGFQTTRSPGGLVEMPHAGNLVVGEGVEIFSNASVATAVFRQSTQIGSESRIGATAFVSHNTKLGKRCFVGHGATVNGNVTIGDDVWIGPGASVANGIRIGDGAYLSLGSVIIRDVAPGERLAGNYAVEHRVLLRHTAKLR